MSEEAATSQTITDTDVESVFGEDGLLSQSVDNYSPRQGQIALAQEIADLKEGEVLIAEAGTGTGKTFAYLVPPLLAGKSIVISTGSRALQDQLTKKDIPNVLSILDMEDIGYMALKGRTNYICRFGFENSKLSGKEMERCRACVEDSLEEYCTFGAQPSFAEINFKMNEEVQEEVIADSFACVLRKKTCNYLSNALRKLHYKDTDSTSSSSDNDNKAAREYTLGYIRHLRDSTVPIDYRDHCFIYAARHEAGKCGVVAVNHALYLSNFDITEEGEVENNKIVPKSAVVIFDEAHNLADVARSLNTEKYTWSRLNNFCTELHALWDHCFSPEISTVIKQQTKKTEQELKSLFNEIYDCFSGLPGENYNINEFKYLHKVDYDEELYPERSQGIALSRLDAAKFRGAGVSTTLYCKNKAKTSGGEQGSLFKGSEQGEAMFASVSRYEDRYLATLPRPSGNSTGGYKTVYEEDGYLQDAHGDPVRDPFFRQMMANIARKLMELHKTLQAYIDDDDANNNNEGDPQLADEPILDLLRFITEMMTTDRNKQGDRRSDFVSYVTVEKISESDKKEGKKADFTLVLTPIEVGRYIRPIIRSLQAEGCRIVFTSATITTNNTFTKFCHDIGLGLNEVKTYQVDSPFNYKDHACLFYSPKFPDIAVKHRIVECIAQVKEAIVAAPGGVFFLTTSYSSLKEAKEELRLLFPRRTVLVQGESSINHLMKEFKEDGHAILVGTSSFWEGVDVPGRALSLVIIDKLPFKGAFDPLNVARFELCSREGGVPFMQISLPEAIIMLRQGVGRLIRKEDDKGALIIMDPRLSTKRYGVQFLRSLPPLKHVSDLKGILSFFDKM